MPWNPEIYEKFKTLRNQPFYDLMALIKSQTHQSAIDLGCGTGEQTAILSGNFPETKFTGIDSSPEMLERSKNLEHDRLEFKRVSTEELLKTGKKWDLIFSNAALQWSDKHQELFPALLKCLHAGGEFVVQMPMQPDNVLNQLLFQLVNEEPFRTKLNGWKRESPVLSIDQYTQLLFDAGLQDINVMLKVYPLIAEDHQSLYDFISGSALVPYMERLSQEDQSYFTDTFKQRIAIHFPKLPAIYAFKRILLYGKNGDNLGRS